MLLKIREKSKGLVSRIILGVISITFALWGIQNYIAGSSGTPIVTVGDRDFYQADIDQAYNQYSRNIKGKFDEQKVRAQAIQRLIREEVLLQHAESSKLVATNVATKNFIQQLEYLQTDGKFDKQRYKSLLAGQQMSQQMFVAKIKKIMLMQQFQQSISDSAFATSTQVQDFLRIQNQTRDVDIITVELPEPPKTKPSDNEIAAFYQANQSKYVIDQRVAIDYVQLALDDLAGDIQPQDSQLQEYFDQNKDLYITKEQRKISHILFAFSGDTADDDKQLQRAIDARKKLDSEDFAQLAKSLSDDEATASKGGDLGLFNVGVMEAEFEDAVTSLKLGEVSQPIKSGFGYHLIKLTELVAESGKTFAEVKDKVKLAYQRQEVETAFYELAQNLAKVSFENPNDLSQSAQLLGVTVKTTGFFSQSEPDPDNPELTSDRKVIEAALSQAVLDGSNSTPIEIASDKIIVLRKSQYEPPSLKTINEVKDNIITSIGEQKSRTAAVATMRTIKDAITAGKTMQDVAKQNGKQVQHLAELSRTSKDLAAKTKQAIFKAAKPSKDKATLITVALPSGVQKIINITKVTPGLATDDKEQKSTSDKIAKALGRLQFETAINNLQGKTDISVRQN